MGQNRSLIVLAGGRSRRMGRDKAALPAKTRPGSGSGTLLERIVARLAPVVDEVIVAGGRRQAGVPARWVPDAVLEAGPMGGMLAGLQAVSWKAAWVVGCDLPDVAPELGSLLFGALGEHDAAVPRLDGEAQGVCAVYATSVIPRIRQLLSMGDRRIGSLLDRSRVHYLEARELREADPSLRSFHNLNTPADYEDWLSEQDSALRVGLPDPSAR